MILIKIGKLLHIFISYVLTVGNKDTKTIQIHIEMTEAVLANFR